MKAKIFLLLTILTAIFQLEVKAQATAYANIFCTIVAPVEITKVMDMSAGKIISGNSGTSNQLSITSESANLGQDGKTNVAAFRISGKNNVFAVTVQNQPLVLLNEKSNSVTVNNFASQTAMVTDLGNGEQRVTISASLNVTKNQPSGNYDSKSPFNVTLNYN